MTTTFEDDIRRVLSNIPRGTVMTYGEVAAESGRPGASRAVGNFLARADGSVPWWRVVTADGRLVPGSELEHAKRLKADGVAMVDGHVVMERRPRHR